MLHNLTDTSKHSAGIYVIRNVIDQRVYVGASKDLLRAFREVRKTLRAGRHGSRQLQAFVSAHGVDVLRFEVVALCSPDRLAATKQLHLNWCRSTDPAHGFNVLATPGFATGQPLSAEHRARISAGKTGRPITPRTAEHQDKLAAAHRGRQRSPETRARISQAVRGKPKRRPGPPTQ